jgi:hypothetical protein
MPNFTEHLAATQQNFAAAGPSALDPTQALVKQALQEQKISMQLDDAQPVLKCRPDFNKVPYQWRPSPFMGKCGYKIQLNKFYSADSPCFPVQDLSCAGPAEKAAWARICRTEFPCKPDPPPHFPKPYRAPPGMYARKPGPSILEALLRSLHENVFPVLGLTTICCLLPAFIEQEPNESEPSETADKPESNSPAIQLN